MSFRVVQDYYRRELFDFFRPYASPFWAVTFELEIGGALEELRRRQYPIYLNLCYLFTRAAQPLEDLRYRLREGEIVLHDRLHAGVTVPAAGGRFRFTYYDDEPEIERFNARLAADGAAGEDAGLGVRVDRDRAWLFFSSLPKIPFTGLTHAYPDPQDDEPRVSFGRFREQGERRFMPVGLQVNHRFVDGAVVGELVERAQSALDGFSRGYNRKP